MHRRVVLCTPRRYFDIRVSVDVIEDYIVPLCDINSLINLSWTNQLFRHILQNIDVLHRWQETSYYVDTSGCPAPCQRNMSYLNIHELCPFLWSVDQSTQERQRPIERHGDILREMRINGRPMGMLIHNLEDHTVSGACAPSMYLDPSQTRGYEGGMFAEAYDTAVVALPRIRHKKPHQRKTVMRNHRGEIVVPSMYEAHAQQHQDDEIEEFWIEHHHTESKEGNLYEDEEDDDLLSEWDRVVTQYGGNAEDVPDTTKCLLYQQMDSLLQLRNIGCQSYPLNHCLHQYQLDYANLEANAAYDWIFVVGGDEDILPRKVMYMNGFVYFVGVLYDHGPGDAVNWMLAMHHIERYMFYRIWRECMMTLIQYVRRHTMDMIEEIETTLRYTEFRERVDLGHRWSTDAFRRDFLDEDDTTIKSLDAVADLMYNVDYQSTWMLILSVNNRGISNEYLYLSHLMPVFDEMICNQSHMRPEDDKRLVVELDHMLRLECFIYHLGNDLIFGGPDGGYIRRGHEMGARDRMNLKIYLQQALCLFMFGPGWRTEYPLHQKPSDFSWRVERRLSYPKRMHPNNTHLYKQQIKWMQQHQATSSSSSLSSSHADAVAMH